MWKAVTLDVKFTSLSPAQNFHLRAVCQRNLFVFDIDDQLTCEHEALQVPSPGLRIIFCVMKPGFP